MNKLPDILAPCWARLKADTETTASRSFHLRPILILIVISVVLVIVVTVREIAKTKV